MEKDGLWNCSSCCGGNRAPPDTPEGSRKAQAAVGASSAGSSSSKGDKDGRRVKLKINLNRPKLPCLLALLVYILTKLLHTRAQNHDSDRYCCF